MVARQRFHKPGIRLMGGLFVGCLAALAQRSGLLAGLENHILVRFSAGTSFDGDYAVGWLQILVILLVSLAPAVLRIEQPLVLIAYGAAVAFIHFLIVSLFLLAMELALPISGAMLGIFGSVAVLETLAWSDERRYRTLIEQIENSRQQFTDMLVHDLKRRMSTILMSLSVLERTDANAAPKRGDLIATIRASAERMLLLTGNLLDIRKTEETGLAIAREPVEVGRLIRECIREHQTALDVAVVSVDVANDDEISVLLDPSLVRRVLANVIWNAIQHTPHGEVIRVAYMRQDKALMLSVQNPGEAIAADEQACLFEAFTSGDVIPDNSLVASTGLGLTFCKLAVEAHGGSIRMCSPADGDQGVRIELSLPS